MHDHRTSLSRPSRKRANRLRRLGNAALFAGVRGAATAIGTALAGLIILWLSHHPR